MKKTHFSTALLALLMAALMVFTTGCAANDADASAERIAQLEQENAALRLQIEQLTANPGQSVESISLKDWSLDAAAWSDGNGATVTFTATPLNYVEGQRAALSVRMGDLEAEGTNCNWDGSAFTGSVELSANDGYSYYCILTNLDGTQEEVELNSPNNITKEALVNLGSNLSAYPNMIVEDWETSGSTLTIKTGYVQCQMPRMPFENAPTSISKAELVLKLNDQEISRQPITMDKGEGEGSFESVLTNCSFTIPAVVEDYQLDLWLDVTLDTGSTMAIIGGSWYSNGGDLQLVVG